MAGFGCSGGLAGMLCGRLRDEAEGEAGPGDALRLLRRPPCSVPPPTPSTPPTPPSSPYPASCHRSPSAPRSEWLLRVGGGQGCLCLPRFTHGSASVPCTPLRAYSNLLCVRSLICVMTHWPIRVSVSPIKFIVLPYFACCYAQEDLRLPIQLLSKGKERRKSRKER